MDMSPNPTENSTHSLRVTCISVIGRMHCQTLEIIITLENLDRLVVVAFPNSFPEGGRGPLVNFCIPKSKKKEALSWNFFLSSIEWNVETQKLGKKFFFHLLLKTTPKKKGWTFLSLVSALVEKTALLLRWYSIYWWRGDRRCRKC